MDSLQELFIILKLTLSANTGWYLWNFRSGLIKRLVEHGYQVTVICPRDEYCKNLQSVGCTVKFIAISSKGKNVLSDMWVFTQYLRAFIKDRPSVYIGFTVKPYIYGSLAAHILGVPAIGTVTGLGTAFIRLTWTTQVVKFLYKVTNRYVATIFFQNHVDKRLFVKQKLVDETKGIVVPGSGINLDEFNVKEIVASRAIDKPVFLFIGRMLKDKGVFEFVDSAVLVKNMFPAAVFQLLGPTNVENETVIEFNQIQEWAEKGIVEYLGVSGDVRPYIQNADCIVLPSYREGVPRTLLEGAAMGRPLIAARSVGCVDVVDDKVTGLLCRPRDSQDLADKMIQFIRLTGEQRKKMAEAGRKKVEREFDEEYVIRRYLHAIQGCLV